MPSKVKVTVSLDESLVRELGEASRRGRKSRSRLVEEALQYWRRSRLEHELKEGYQAMAQEDRLVLLLTRGRDAPSLDTPDPPAVTHLRRSAERSSRELAREHEVALQRDMR